MTMALAVLHPDERVRVLTAAGRYKGLDRQNELKGVID